MKSSFSRMSTNYSFAESMTGSNPPAKEYSYLCLSSPSTLSLCFVDVSTSFIPFFLAICYLIYSLFNLYNTESQQSSQKPSIEKNASGSSSRISRSRNNVDSDSHSIFYNARRSSDHHGSTNIVRSSDNDKLVRSLSLMFWGVVCFMVVLSIISIGSLSLSALEIRKYSFSSVKLTEAIVSLVHDTLNLLTYGIAMGLYLMEVRYLFKLRALAPWFWGFLTLFSIFTTWANINDRLLLSLPFNECTWEAYYKNDYFWLVKSILSFVESFLGAVITLLISLIMVYENTRKRHNRQLQKQIEESAANAEDEQLPLLAGSTSAQSLGAEESQLGKIGKKAKSGDGSEDPIGGRSPSFMSRLRDLLPFLWPKGELLLNLQMSLSLAFLVLGRVINVYVPLQFKVVIDSFDDLDPVTHDKIFAWAAILVYVILRFLQGGVGLVMAIQNLLWIRVGQYSTREISVKVFKHLHNLSLQFHLNRKTGEVLRVMDRGTASIVSLLNSILFNIFPTIVDIIVACFFFVTQFDGWFGMVVFITMFSYIGVTILVTEWRTKFRRLMNDLENKSSTKAVDSLLNFETVKYYGAEAYEVSLYKETVVQFQEADWQSQASLNVLNLSQNIIITLGLLAGSLICAWQVRIGKLSVGDFVLFLTYITQLYAPLNWFGTYYRVIQQNIIDMEKMLDLLMEKVEIKDKPHAPDLKVTFGHVKFDNVCFSYGNGIQALKGVSFEIKPGETVALVGSSGGGKSTILRLLFRFYDVNSGSISIDGTDIREITAQSLRSSIGVVPQDTVLFNDTIRYNIRYGRVGASDGEVEEAAKAAQIHEKILTFPEGYETRVGERGLRLSGGEKQRVAIARTILKDPKIIVLDEATSALDTNTERHIQTALSKMTEGRTTLIVAHRLSTIIHADKILVLDQGLIVESGSHLELLQRYPKGIYADLWSKQSELQQ